MDEPERLIRMRAVVERTSLSRATIYRKANAGSFPAPVKITDRMVRWRETEVARWMLNPATWSKS